MLTAEFTHVVFKRLSAVEADPSRSNQHEFNASKTLRDAFGKEQPRRIDTDFVWMPDDGDFVTEAGYLTWYDSRARHPTRSEFRLYYRDNAVTRRAATGALLLIALRSDGTVLLVLAPETGVAATRISWLFGIEVAPGAGFAALSMDPAAGLKLASRFGATSNDGAAGWTEEPEMTAARPDNRIRNSTAAAQKEIGHVESSNDVLWEEVLLHLPDHRPVGIDGPGLERTVRGIIAPRS